MQSIHPLQKWFIVFYSQMRKRHSYYINSIQSNGLRILSRYFQMKHTQTFSFVHNISARERARKKWLDASPIELMNSCRMMLERKGKREMDWSNATNQASELASAASASVTIVAITLKWMCVSLYLHLGQLKWSLNRLNEWSESQWMLEFLRF